MGRRNDRERAQSGILVRHEKEKKVDTVQCKGCGLIMPSYRVKDHICKGKEVYGKVIEE